MAQNTILAEGSTANQTSTDVVIVSGGTAAVGLFVASGSVGADALAYIYMDTPGQDAFIDSLRSGNPVKVIAGPCTIRVTRKSGTFGVFSET